MVNIGRVWKPDFPFDPARLPFFYGWVVAWLGALAMVASVPGQTIGVNVFSEKLMDAFSLDRNMVSFAYLFGTGASGFLLPFAGRLFDRLGSRRMVVMASVGLALSLFYMSQSDRIAGALLGLFGDPLEMRWGRFAFLVFGFFCIRFWGQGMLSLTAKNLVGRWWKFYRGKVLSMSGIAVSVCFSLAPMFFNDLIASLGWRMAWQALGCALLVGFSIFGWLAFRDSPESCGQKIDGGRTGSSLQRGNPEFTIYRDFTRAEAIRTYPLWLFCSVFALQSCYYTAYTFHVIDLGKTIGVSEGAILAWFVPAALVGGCVSLAVGWLSDRWRLKYLIMSMAIGISLAPIGLLANHPVFMPVLVILGFAIAGGSFSTIAGAFIPRFYGFANMGAISGAYMSIVVLASAVGPWLFSVCKTYYGSYDLAHWIAGPLALVLAIAALWADNPQRKLAR